MLDPDLRRTWIFGLGADSRVHDSMLECGADVLIVDLEDFTPPPRRGEARELLATGCGRTSDYEWRGRRPG